MDTKPTPHVIAAPVADMPGTEVWRFMNWVEPGTFCLPKFAAVIQTHAALKGARFKKARREFAVGADGVHFIVPHQVTRLLEVIGEPLSGNQQTVVAILLPESILDVDEMQALATRRVEPAVEDQGLVHAVHQLIALVAANDQPCCVKQERARAVVERLLGRSLPAIPAKGCHRSVVRAREFVDAHYARSFSLEDVAHEVGLSKWHLARAFRAQLDISIGEYTRRVRASRALELLRQGMKPSAAFGAVGYSDQPHMTRELRSLLGFTPAEYHRAHHGRSATKQPG
jgi:AraC-like DNA-binding protein